MHVNITSEFLPVISILLKWVKKHAGYVYIHIHWFGIIYQGIVNAKASNKPSCYLFAVTTLKLDSNLVTIHCYWKAAIITMMILQNGAELQFTALERPPLI